MCESGKVTEAPRSEWEAKKQATAGCNTRPPMPTVRQHLQRSAEQALKQALFYTTRMNALPKSTLDMTLEEYHKSVNLHPPYDESDAQF